MPDKLSMTVNQYNVLDDLPFALSLSKGARRRVNGGSRSFIALPLKG